MRSRGWGFLAAFWCLSSLSWADDRSSRIVPAVRLNDPPTIDGVIGEDEWRGAPILQRFFDERLGQPMADQTVVRVAYDDVAIYVAFLCADAKPSEIVARETRRNAGFQGEDRFRVWLNLFNTRVWNDDSRFEVNALGTQNAQIAGGRAAKQEWQGTWSSAARRTETGWQGEMAIPWAIFARPDAANAPIVVGLNFERHHARLQASSVFSYLGPQERSELVGQWTGIQLPRQARPDPLSAIWYTVGGFDRRRLGGRAGFDLRYAMDSQRTALLSVNPDFGNVESAVTSIDFTYAERLPGETRPFFQEGSGYFSSILNSVRPFASQRIGAFDAGAKFFGRMDAQTSVGALATLDAGKRMDATLNVRRQFGPRTRFSLEAVTRHERTIDNTVVALYGRTNPGDWGLGANYFRSADRASRGEAGALEVGWNTRTTGFNGAYLWVSPGFRARDGFVQFRDQRSASGELYYYGDFRTGPFTEAGVSISGVQAWRYSGADFRESLGVNLWGETRSHWSFNASASAGSFEAYRDRLYSVSVGYPTNDRFRNFGLGYSSGRQAGEDYDALSANAEWRLFGRLQLGGSVEWVRLGEVETQNVLRATYDLSNEASLGGRMLWRRGKPSAFLTFRKSGYGGAEWFVILGNPSRDGFESRLVVKLVGAT